MCRAKVSDDDNCCSDDTLRFDVTCDELGHDLLRKPVRFADGWAFAYLGALSVTKRSLPVLTNVARPSVRRKAAPDNMLPTIEAHPHWPVHADVFEHPLPRLASRHPIWSDMAPVDTNTQWREDWYQLLWSTTLLSPTLISDNQVSISLIAHGLCSTVSGPCHAISTNGVLPNHLPMIVACDRPKSTWSTRAY